VHLIQPTDGIARQGLSQPAAILCDAFDVITDVLSQVQTVIGGLAHPSLSGAHADLNTVELYVGRPERERCH
jgi:hypothetical protein